MTNTIFPNKIHLLGEVFNIKEVLKRNISCKTCGDNAVGKIDWTIKTIYVAIDAEEETPEQILFHELGHYFGFYYGISKSEIMADAFCNFIELIIKQLGYKK